MANENKVQYQIGIFLFFGFLMSLLISQSLMDLMSFLVIIYSLITRPFWKQAQLTLPFPKIFLAWFVVQTLGILLAASPWSETTVKNLIDLKWIINFYFLIWFFEDFFRHGHFLEQEKTWKILGWGLALLSVYAILCWVFDFNLIDQSPLSNPRRTGGIFDEPMTFAHVYGPFLGFFFGLSLYSEGFSKKIFSVVTILAGVAVFLSFTRGIWVGATCGLLFACFLKNRKLGLLSLASACSLVALLFFTWPQFHDRVMFVFNASQNYDQDRVWLWKANWKMFLDHPLLGIGFGEYKNILRSYFDALGAPPGQMESHAHNQYLHMLAGTGLAGFIIYICFIFGLFKRIFQAWKNSKSPFHKGIFAGVMAALICFWIGGLTEANFDRAKVRMTFLAFSALAIAFTKISNNARSTNEKV